MNALQKAINTYQHHVEELGTVLANQEDQRVVQLWLQSHQVFTYKSPMLSEFRNRITPGAPVQFTPDIVQVEGQILAGKFQELLAYFKASPGELPKKIDLIKTHLELNTLSISNEWLPLLLDHATTEDIKEILKLADFTDYSALSRFQMVRLGAVMPENDPRAATFPPFIQQYRQVLHNKKMFRPQSDDINGIRNINWLNDEEKYCALAHYIEKSRCPLGLSSFPENELLRMAPYLRYVNMMFTRPDVMHGFVSRCPNLNVVIIKHKEHLAGVAELPLCQMFESMGSNLRTLPRLPLCKWVNCSNNGVLETLPELPLCQRLSCDRCTALSALPALPLCVELSCTYCNFITLPSLPLCEKIDCKKCPSLEAIAALPLCKNLDCCDCPALRLIEALPVCKDLYCCNCKSLNALPPLPLCEVVNCPGTSLKYLPELPLCKNLLCYNCADLIAIPELPQCTNLNSYNCPALISIPQMPLCQAIQCYDSIALKTIGSQPLCQWLDCHGCTTLTEIGAQPLCKGLDYHDCIALAVLPQQLPHCETLACFGSTAPLPAVAPGAKIINRRQ